MITDHSGVTDFRGSRLGGVIRGICVSDNIRGCSDISGTDFNDDHFSIKYISAKL